jgi:hypothetical protein
MRQWCVLYARFAAMAQGIAGEFGPEIIFSAKALRVRVFGELSEH